MKKSELRQLIREEISKVMNENSKLDINNVESIDYAIAEFNGRSLGRLYKLYVYMKKGGKEWYRTVEQFNDAFGTKLPDPTHYEEFKEGIELLNPKITVTKGEYDVS